MKVEQIFTLLNSVSGEVLGKTDLIKEDLSNVVDFGEEIFGQNQMDNYVKSLVNHIGKVVFVNRPYAGKVPSVLMDAWEFGSVMEKVSADIPDATENKSWQLEDGQTYEQDVFHKPKVTAKFFNNRVTFEVPLSITQMQVKESFSDATQLNGFLSMLYAAVEKSMTIKTDALIMRTINAAIAESVTYNADGYAGVTSARAVNLLKLYNDHTGDKLTAAKAIYDPSFIRYASFVMAKYVDRLGSISTLFNAGGKERFTPKEMLRVVMLSDFAQAAKTYLYSDTFHSDEVTLPKADVIPSWQGSGKAYDFADVSAIDVQRKDGNEIKLGGVLAVMFDRDALGVTNLDRRVTTNYNARAEFYNNWYKFDAGYFCDLNENFVVFYVA